MPKESSQQIGPLVILIDSVFKMRKNYYPQHFLENGEYIVKEKEMIQHLTEDVEFFSSHDSVTKYCDEGISDEEKYDE